MTFRYIAVRSSLREQLTALSETTSRLLPGERQLAAHYGVARITVRKALDGLEAEGLIKRRVGLGTSVLPESR